MSAAVPTIVTGSLSFVCTFYIILSIEIGQIGFHIWYTKLIFES